MNVKGFWHSRVRQPKRLPEVYAGRFACSSQFWEILIGDVHPLSDLWTLSEKIKRVNNNQNTKRQVHHFNSQNYTDRPSKKNKTKKKFQGFWLKNTPPHIAVKSSPICRNNILYKTKHSVLLSATRKLVDWHEETLICRVKLVYRGCKKASVACGAATDSTSGNLSV